MNGEKIAYISHGQRLNCFILYTTHARTYARCNGLWAGRVDVSLVYRCLDLLCGCGEGGKAQRLLSDLWPMEWAIRLCVHRVRFRRSFSPLDKCISVRKGNVVLRVDVTVMPGCNAEYYVTLVCMNLSRCGRKKFLWHPQLFESSSKATVPKLSHRCWERAFCR